MLGSRYKKNLNPSHGKQISGGNDYVMHVFDVFKKELSQKNRKSVAHIEKHKSTSLALRKKYDDMLSGLGTKLGEMKQNQKELEERLNETGSTNKKLEEELKKAIANEAKLTSSLAELKDKHDKALTSATATKKSSSSPPPKRKRKKDDDDATSTSGKLWG